ncbi:unnamed protein product [Rhizophagus irregularis]|nr:unnamed protein product [Rhizophagus irregularis]
MASKNSYLSQPVLDKIKHYTIDGHLGASQQYDFLTKATHIFPAVLFTDGDPAMNAAIQVMYPQTCHLLCIYHITENIKKKARSKLYGEMVHNFIKDFYHMRNSYSQDQFESRYNSMLIKYEAYRSYLEKKLYPIRESWARYSIAKVFTAEIKSTRRVESINGVLKKHLDQGNFIGFVKDEINDSQPISTVEIKKKNGQMANQPKICPIFKYALPIYGKLTIQ